jgi:hypothetical protein
VTGRTKNLMNRALGISDVGAAGLQRTLAGLREGDRRQLSLGLVLAAIAYLQRTRPRRQLIHRQVVRSGSALVIHHKKTGAPRLEIIKPKG